MPDENQANRPYAVKVLADAAPCASSLMLPEQLPRRVQASTPGRLDATTLLPGTPNRLLFSTLAEPLVTAAQVLSSPATCFPRLLSNPLFMGWHKDPNHELSFRCSLIPDHHGMI